MALEEGIHSLMRLEIELRDAYLNRLIDFLKWTSTIALAAGLWIGTNFNKYVEPVTKTIIDNQSSTNSSISYYSNFFGIINPIFLILSFGAIIMSLFVSVIIFYLILGLWELEWKYIGMMNPVIDFFNKNRDKETLSDDVLSKRIDEVKAFHFKYKNIKSIQMMFKIHVIFLIIGIFCFFTSILFH
jgi:hypothetical protein